MHQSIRHIITTLNHIDLKYLSRSDSQLLKKSLLIFFPLERIFQSYGDITFAVEGLQISDEGLSADFIHVTVEFVFKVISKNLFYLFKIQVCHHSWTGFQTQSLHL